MGIVLLIIGGLVALSLGSMHRDSELSQEKGKTSELSRELSVLKQQLADMGIKPSPLASPAAAPDIHIDVLPVPVVTTPTSRSSTTTTTRPPSTTTTTRPAPTTTTTTTQPTCPGVAVLGRCVP